MQLASDGEEALLTIRGNPNAVDPMLPPERPKWLRPEHALLTCRQHDRDAWKLGCTVWVVEQGAHELEGRGEFRTYRWGDELPGGVVAYEVAALTPDETALHVPGHRALAFGDAVIRWEANGALDFVPDRFMDDPERDKAGLRASFTRLLELDFDLLLLGHGNPVVGGAKEELRTFSQV